MTENGTPLGYSFVLTVIILTAHNFDAHRPGWVDQTDKRSEIKMFVGQCKTNSFKSLDSSIKNTAKFVSS